MSKNKIEEAIKAIESRDLGGFYYFGNDILSPSQVDELPDDCPCCAIGALVISNPELKKKYMRQLAENNNRRLMWFEDYTQFADDIERVYGLLGSDLPWLQDTNDRYHDNAEGRKAKVLELLRGRQAGKTMIQMYNESTTGHKLEELTND